MSTEATIPTYDEHVQAIADAFDADFQAALALHQAQERKNETRRALHAARRALKQSTDAQVYEITQTTSEEVQRAYLGGRCRDTQPLRGRGGSR